LEVQDVRRKISDLEPAEKSAYLIDILKKNPLFHRLSELELHSIQTRDTKDNESLSEGIQFALCNGLIPPKSISSPWIQINVENRSPADIAMTIKNQFNQVSGNVIAISGKSGVGKGTIVNKLNSIVPNSVVWSNGNVFRSIAYLAKIQFPQECAQGNFEFLPIDRISDQIIINDDGKITLSIDDSSIDLVDIQDTKLKTTSIESLVPSIAQVSQRQVINKVNAFFQYSQDKIFIIEGRKITLDYIQSLYKCELLLNRAS
jgi:hypothetical protein